MLLAAQVGARSLCFLISTQTSWQPGTLSRSLISGFGWLVGVADTCCPAAGACQQRHSCKTNIDANLTLPKSQIHFSDYETN